MVGMIGSLCRVLSVEDDHVCNCVYLQVSRKCGVVPSLTPLVPSLTPVFLLSILGILSQLQ